MKKNPEFQSINADFKRCILLFCVCINKHSCYFCFQKYFKLFIVLSLFSYPNLLFHSFQSNYGIRFYFFKYFYFIIFSDILFELSYNSQYTKLMKETITVIINPKIIFSLKKNSSLRDPQYSIFEVKYWVPHIGFFKNQWEIQVSILTRDKYWYWTKSEKCDILIYHIEFFETN